MGRSEPWPWQNLALVERAMAIATEVHAGVLRKGTTIPYLSHIWSVGALVLEHGGDDAQVAAALLHDTVEDGGGACMLARLRLEFAGSDVADLVEHLSDSLIDTGTGATKEAWFPRKNRYLEGMAGAGSRVMLVSACDKLHNLRCILADYRVHGSGLWTRFSQTEPAAHAWYYDSLVRSYVGRVPLPLSDELHRTLDELLRLVEVEVPDLAAGMTVPHWARH
jgi:(p)ppGpp synthase/HD superfamily hydrolase